MKAKFVNESLETSDIHERIEEHRVQLQKYFNPKDQNLEGLYGYYNMSNSLDMVETVIPVLREHGIKFEYSGLYNFLAVVTKNEEEAKIAAEALDEAEGYKYDVEWELENNEEYSDDAAIIV